jgi:hypothetical protein
MISLSSYEVGAAVAVSDMERAKELTSKGVAFEQYDEPPIETDEKGIATFEDGRVAYFRDPDGNTLSVGDR